MVPLFDTARRRGKRPGAGRKPNLGAAFDARNDHERLRPGAGRAPFAGR